MIWRNRLFDRPLRKRHALRCAVGAHSVEKILEGCATAKQHQQQQRRSAEYGHSLIDQDSCPIPNPAIFAEKPARH